MQLAPIALFVYKRPLHTQKTLAALKANHWAKYSDLYIFADGPKNSFSDKDHEQLSKTRKLIKNIKGFKKVTIKESRVNKGLATSVITGVTQLIDEYGSVIVIEDDLITGKGFIQYMNNALNLYKNQEEVISIHGYNLPIKVRNLTDTFFLKGADCWGWATWKRGWELYNPDTPFLIDQLVAKNMQASFNLNNSYPYMNMLKDQVDGKIDSWAINWYASAFLNNKLTLYPKKSLVTNIGLDGSGTHSGIKKFKNKPATKCKIYAIPLQESDLALKYIEEYYSHTGSFIKKLVNRILTRFK